MPVLPAIAPMRAATFMTCSILARGALALLATGIAIALGTGDASSDPATPPPERDPMLLAETESVTLKATLSATVAGISYAGTWFGLAQPILGIRFAPRRSWSEGWIQPGLNLSVRPAPSLEFYSGVSVGLSGTLGADPYGFRNMGAALPETAYVGIRTTRPDGDLNIDFSIGQQPYIVGTGMLLAQGAGNGLERGAVSLAPRAAWANAAISKVTWRGLSAEAFYLDPNEIPAENTGTKLAGAFVENKWGKQSRVGGAYISVLDSTAPYVLASAPFILDGGRSGLRTWYGWSRVDGTPVGLENAWLRLEGASQSNDRISLKASAWYAEIGHRFERWPFAPAISYGYGIFSGDNPRTARVERFDPLFYGNGYDNWWFGANSSLAWLNSNVAYHRATAKFDLSDRDFVTLQVLRAVAAERFSPLQFGQGARIGLQNGEFAIITGVSRSHLSDEISAAWTREWSKAATSLLWASASIPGSGLKTLPGVDAKAWYSIGAMISIQY